MKRILLLGAGILLANFMNAQVIFSGESPEDVVGNYNFTYPTDWGADLTLPANAVMDELVLYDDAGNKGCNFAGNEAELTGHIAILRRGDCEFGLKALNAQNAGAIAVVIVNNEPGDPIPMGGGDNGSSVTIPVVMVGQADGEMLITKMEEEPVVVFIGSKMGYYENDIGMDEKKIVRPKFSQFPLVYANAGDGYEIDFVADVFNYGSEDQDGIALTATITLDGVEIYSATSDMIDLLAGDSAEMSVPSYSSTEWEEGVYTLTYSVVGNQEDDYNFDNEIVTVFAITADRVSNASFDENGLPNSGNGIRPADAVDFFSLCTYFKDENASELYFGGMAFTALKGSDAIDPSMEGEELFLRVIKVNDQFTSLDDITSPIGSSEELIMESYVYMEDTEDIQVHYFEEGNRMQLVDNQRYFFCVGSFNDEIFVGSDPSIQYDGNIGFYNQPYFPIEVGSNSYNPYGFQSVPTPSISMLFFTESQVGLANEEKAINMSAYPSPAMDVLNVDFKGSDVKNLELISITGQVVSAQAVTQGTEKTAINVANVENGVYIVKVTLTNNLTHTMRVVVAH